MAGEGGAEGSILGVCGGVLPLDKLLVLPEDAFLRGLLHTESRPSLSFVAIIFVSLNLPVTNATKLVQVVQGRVTNLLETCLQSPVGQERPMAHFPSHTSRANAMVS